MVYQRWEQGIGVAVEDADRQANESLTRPDVVDGAKALAERRAPRFARLEFEG